MGMLLDRVNEPKDIKSFNREELDRLSSEIRKVIIETVSRTGGHLASSLGAVELTVALHYVFDAPRDRIIWDVGHQAYAHKLLTGRRRAFKSLRQSGGISGFPTPSESPYDAFGVGHSSTSISAGLGMVAARDLRGEEYKVVSVIGDGSLTAGLAFEGLNQAGHLKKDLIVVLNDNEMSIARNVGALSSFLSRKFTGRFINKLKRELESFLHSIPRIGDGIVSFAKRAEDSLISLLTPGMLFEGLGFNYIGPIDGHNIDQLIKAFEDVKGVAGPHLIHVLTKKGKGYPPAEENPSYYHGIGPFDISTGKTTSHSSTKPTYTKVFSDALIEIAGEREDIIAITAAMPEGTGLDAFARAFPDRFCDVGIAEQHAVTFAAGLAISGLTPVVAIYSTFLQRGFDQIVHDVCLQNLHVVFAIDRAGIVGADGPTHQGIFDLAYLRQLPNMVVMAPKDEAELRDMLKTAVEIDSPVAIRYPRGRGIGVEINREMETIEIGRGEYLRQGRDIGIIAIGSCVYPALDACRILEDEGFDVAFVNARFARPVPGEDILRLIEDTNRLLTVEENVLSGGFGSGVLEFIEEKGITGVSLRRIGIPDTFVRHGTQDELRREFGLDADGIARAARSMILGDVREGKRATR